MKTRLIAALVFLVSLPALAQNYTPTRYIAWLTSSDGGNTFQPNDNVLGGSPNYTPTEYAAILCQSAAGQPYQLCTAGSSGTVTSIATTSPITGGPITGSGTIACPTCLTTATAPLSCQPGIGDGFNAIPAGTYLTTTCRNETGQTWTLTAIRCVADSGSSTCAVTNGAGTSLLTGAITGTSTYANGTQSATTTVASGDYLKVTYVADGTTKQIGIDVAGTY